MTTMPDAITFAKSELTKATRLLRCAVDKSLPPTASFAQREAAWLAVGNEAMRIGLEDELQRLSDGCGAEVLVNGERHRRHLDGKVPGPHHLGAQAIHFALGAAAPPPIPLHRDPEVGRERRLGHLERTRGLLQEQFAQVLRKAMGRNQVTQAAWRVTLRGIPASRSSSSRATATN